MTDPRHNAKTAEEFEKRLLDIAWSAVCKVKETYKRHTRTAPDEIDRVKMLENVEQELSILREGGPFL